MSKIEPLLTIGLPTYNGEKTIKRTIESILSQTFTNFQLIISDDGSTDSTPEICREYEKKDNRIKFVQRKGKKGSVWNFIFLAEKSNTKYFVWIAHDDYWELQFIKKNIEILEKNNKIVGSISDVQLVGLNIKNYYTNQKILDTKYIDSKYTPTKFEFVRSNKGTYDEKVKNILKFTWVLNFYSIFRTEKLQESLVHNVFAGWDWVIVLNIAKFGDLHVLDEVLAYRDTEGITSRTIIERLKAERAGWFKTYFPNIPLTIWCLRNIGLKNCIIHNAFFRYINFHTAKKIIRELIS